MELSYGKLRDPAACSTLVGVSTERKSQCLKAELGDPSQASLRPLSIIQSLPLGSAGSGRKGDYGFKRARGFQMLGCSGLCKAQCKQREEDLHT